MEVDVLLIGGGIACASAAEELRVQGFGGSIALLGRELDPPYHRPPITKELLRGVASREDALIRPAGWWEEQGIDLRTRASVVALDPAARTATLASKEVVSYRHALVATGAMVRRISADGARLDGIHYLRTPGNAETLRAEAQDARRVVVVGGSYIACEVAASLTLMGKQVAMVMQERVPFERGFGSGVGDWVAAELRARGVELHGGEEVAAFTGDGRVDGVRTGGGAHVAGELVVVGVGVTPDVVLARRSGLAIGETGGVACDEGLRTSVEGVYAAGDVCEYESVVHGRRLRVEHEDHAERQGRHVARAIATGDDAPYAEVPYFWTDLGDWASLEYVGPADRWDEERIDGALPDGDFLVRYLADGRLVAALASGRPDALEAARTEIAGAAA